MKEHMMCEREELSITKDFVLSNQRIEMLSSEKGKITEKLGVK